MTFASTAALDTAVTTATAAIMGGRVTARVSGSVAESTSRRRFRRSAAAGLAVSVLLAFQPASAGALLDYIRDYDLNNYSLGASVSTSQSPYTGAPNSIIAYPYLTSFQHSAFTDDWFLIRGENIGFRYTTSNDWEFGVIGRIQTLGFGGADSDELRGLDERRWSIEAGPIIGWPRKWISRSLLIHYWGR